MRKVLILAVLGLAAAGCSQKTDTAAASDPAPAAVAAASADAAGPAATAAPAMHSSGDAAMDVADGPAPGKWRITTTMSAMPAAMPPIETCYAKTTFAEMQKKQQGAGVQCSEQSFNRQGDAMIGHSVCTVNGMKTTTDMTITGDVKTAYTMDMTMKMDPPPAPGMGEQKMTIKAQRLGDCDS